MDVDVKKCIECGGAITNANTVYCSKKCSLRRNVREYTRRKNGVVLRAINCVICGAQINTYYRNQKKCKKCNGLETKATNVVCSICNKSFISKNRNWKYCSYNCRLRARNKRRIKKNGTKSRRIVEMVGKCENCGFSNVLALHAHHINQNHEQQYEIDNLMVLCANCHYIYHKKLGDKVKISNNTKERIRELICQEEESEMG